MKGILLLAALHILIIYQSQKKHSKQNNVLPAPSSTPAITPTAVPGNDSQVASIHGYPGFLSVFYYGNTRKLATNAVAGF